MISAFGVEHVSKSFNRVGANLGRAMDKNPYPGTEMGRRTKWNYMNWRKAAGDTGGSRFQRQMGKPGESSIASARRAKEGARAMVTGSANFNRRNRVLP